MDRSTLCIITLAVLATCCSCQETACFNTTSDTPYCVYRETSPLTWQEAHQSCVSRGMVLATIPSKEAHDSLASWDFGRLWDVRWTGDRYGVLSSMWTGGRRSSDVTWQPASGSNTDSNTGNLDNGGIINCAQWSLKDGLSSANCSSRENKAYCQYLPTEDGCSTATMDMLRSGRCHHFSSDAMSWFDASNYCRNVQGRYLVTVPLDPEDSSGSRLIEDTYWADFVRRPWQWHVQTGSLAMDFYGFEGYEGSDEATNGSCLYVLLTGRGALSWVDAPCSNQLDTYLCQQAVDVTTAPGPVSYPVGSTTSGPIAAVTGTSLTVIATCSVVGVLVVAATVGAAVFCYCRSKTKTPPALPSRIPIGFPYAVDAASLSAPDRATRIPPIPTLDTAAPDMVEGYIYDTATNVTRYTSSSDVTPYAVSGNITTDDAGTTVNITGDITPYATSGDVIIMADSVAPYATTGVIHSATSADRIPDTSFDDVTIPSEHTVGELSHVVAPNGDVYTQINKKLHE